MADAKITALAENTTPLGTDLLAIVDDPAGTPVTQKIMLTSLGLIDGWVPASETWTYVSAQTFTVSGDVTAKYSKGTRLKWTQTTVKYGVVVASSYGAPDTTVTILTTTDYTIANAAISLNYYSYQYNPQLYPGWFALAAPTFDVTYYDNGAGGQPTTTEHRARIDGNMCTVHYRGTGTKAGTNPYIVISAMVAPLSANTTTHTAIGTFWFTDAYQGTFCKSANPWIAISISNITDNTAATAFTFTITYEI